MEKRGKSLDLKDFVRKVIATDFGLLLLTGVIAWSVDLHFAIILFGLGILCAVIGSYLGGPNTFDPKNPRISHRNPYEYPSAERLRARIMHVVKNSVPMYAVENVLFFAGLIAILISLLFLF